MWNKRGRVISGASRTVLFFEYFREVAILISISVLAAVSIYVFYDNYLVSFLPFMPNIEFIDFKLILQLVIVMIAVTLLAGIYPSVILSSQKTVKLFRKRIGT